MLASETKNQYVELASRCYRQIEALAEPLGPEISDRVPGAALAFWTRLAWADESISATEREIFRSICPDGDPAESRFAVVDHDLESLMCAVAEYDEETGTRLGRKFASQFESFGYAILASDRKITDGEFETLKASMRRLYGTLAFA